MQQKNGVFFINQTNSLNLRQKSAKNPATLRMIRGVTKQGGHPMRVSFRFFTLFRFACAAAVLWTCGIGAARAGGGGEDTSTAQSLLDVICSEVGMPTASCPKLPT